MGWWVYILRCRDGTLYTGSTSDVERRAAAHAGGKGAKYTRGRGPIAVVYREECPDKGAALRREAAIKKLKRPDKLNLIAAYAERRRNMKKAAFYSALSEKIRQEQVVVLDKFALAEPKTKLVAEAVDALKLSGKTLFVVEEYDEAAVRASKNIPTVSLEEVRLLSVYDIVAARNLVLTKGAIKKIEEAAQ